MLDTPQQFRTPWNKFDPFELDRRSIAKSQLEREEIIIQPSDVLIKELLKSRWSEAAGDYFCYSLASFHVGQHRILPDESLSYQAVLEQFDLRV